MLARRIADLTHARSSLEAQAAHIQRDFSLVVEAYRNANRVWHLERALRLPSEDSLQRLLVQRFSKVGFSHHMQMELLF